MIGRPEIKAARERIGARLRRTPVVSLPDGAIAGVTGAITFKLENCQVTGSFKPRGVFSRVLSESSLPETGLVAASGGNHGAAVAYAARALGLPCEVFLPSVSPTIKRGQLRALGAKVTVAGEVFAEALEVAEARAAESGALSIHAFDHPAVVAGQGTLAAELEEQAPDLDTLLVAVGGGGFIGGIAAWYTGQIRVIAVEAEGSPSLARAREAGRPVNIATGGLAADSLGCRRVGEIGFAITQRFVEHNFVVSEGAIRRAQRLLWDELRVIAEPGGAVALAALVEGSYVPALGERVGVIVCGGNTDPAAALA